MTDLACVEEMAERILAENLDPVLRFRLLRGVLRRPVRNAEVVECQRWLDESPWIRQLVSEQRPDGSWGRFHSQDTAVRQAVPTTEFGVERGLALGLDYSHPILHTTAGYIASILQRTTQFPDPPERNPRWLLGIQLFAGATLARINPSLPVLDPLKELWRTIALRTFASGEYDTDAEQRAHREVTGLTGDLRYLTLDSKYQATLLGAQALLLPPSVQRAYLRWLWTKPDGLRYKNVTLSHPPAQPRSSAVELWLSSIELLTPFVVWRDLAKPAIDWLWTRRTDEGFWDFGNRASSTTFLPLSDSWRQPQSRQFDWTTRVLLLLRQYHEPRRRPADQPASESPDYSPRP